MTQQSYPLPRQAVPVSRRVLRLLSGVAITLVALWLCLPMIDWTVVNAVWQGDAETCRKSAGACWAFIANKYTLILFGIYPHELYWRPGTVLAVFALLALASAQRRLWGKPLAAIWLTGLVLSLWLMGGGFGLVPVSTSNWGGLPLSFLLASISLLFGYPLAIGLALMRRSELVVLRWTSSFIVETVRGIPLLAMLFIAVMITPLFMPPGFQLNKLVSVFIGLILFSGAYLSEIVRAGMQVIGRGQYEAAKTLGMKYLPTQLTIVIPQSFRVTLPALVTTVIGFFQDTTLVIVIGVFDLLNAARAAAVDPQWLGFSLESFVFVGVIYFVISALIARYGRWLEKQLNTVR